MPSPVFSTLQGDLVTLQFDAELRSSNPAPSRFRVTADNLPVQVLSTSVSSTEALVQLTLEEAPAPGAQIRVVYTDLFGEQSTGVIELIDGTDVSSFTVDVLNDTLDSDPPQLDGASVIGGDLVLDFNEVLASGGVATNSFSVLVNNRRISVTNAEATGNQVLLSLAKPVVFGDDVTVSYSDLQANQTSLVIQDAAGNDAGTFSREPVVNNSIDETPLSFAGATVNGKTLEINFDRELSDTTPSNRAFRVEADGQLIAVRAAEVFAIDRQVVLTLAEAVTNQQRVTVSYVDPAGDQRSGVVEDIQGNDLVGFTKRPVQNDTRDLNPISLESADVEGDQITLGFSKELGDSEPSFARFKVVADGKLRKVTDIETSPADGRIVLTLDRAIAANAKSVSLAYSDPLGNQRAGIIEDTNGVDLSGFSILPQNFTTDEVTPVVVDAEVQGDSLRLTFNKELDGASTPRNGAFRVLAGGERVRVTGVEVKPNDTTVGLKLARAISRTEDVLITYRDPLNDQSSGVIQDPAGNDVETFRDLIVDNASASPSFSSFRDSGSLSAMLAPAADLF